MKWEKNRIILVGSLSDKQRYFFEQPKAIVGMKMNLSRYIDQVSELCTAYGVARLELFGSAARSDFDPDSSDMDFLVDFSDAHSLGAFDRYFGLKEALEQLFRRSVDLVERRAIKNPYFRQAIEGNRVVVYGTRSQETDL